MCDGLTSSSGVEPSRSIWKTINMTGCLGSLYKLLGLKRPKNLLLFFEKIFLQLLKYIREHFISWMTWLVISWKIFSVNTRRYSSRKNLIPRISVNTVHKKFTLAPIHLRTFSARKLSLLKLSKTIRHYSQRSASPSFSKHFHIFVLVRIRYAHNTVHFSLFLVNDQHRHGYRPASFLAPSTVSVVSPAPRKCSR